MNLIAATYTPLKEDGSLNLAKINDYTEFLKRNRIKGAFINGTTGDFVSLSDQERMRIAESWSDQRSSDFQVINNVGHNSLQQAIILAKQAANHADAIAALPPFYFKIKRLEDLLHYCTKVAEAAPHLPFYYYHIPVLTHANLKMEAFCHLALEKIPNFKGIKFSHNDLVDFERCILMGRKTARPLEMFFGIDEMFVNSLSLGGNGWVGSTYNHIAPLYARIQDLYHQDQSLEALEMQNKAVLFVETLDAIGGYGGTSKALMSQLGIDLGPSRFPHQNIEKSIASTLRTKLADIGITDELLNQ